jgi:hypothetical protein
MNKGPATLDFITLGIAVWGALLSTAIAVTKRRRKLLVAAGFGTARLGDIRNHAFFVVRVINTGQRAVTIPALEWVAEDFVTTHHVFKHSKGRDLPVKVEPDEEVQILFDVGVAAGAIAQGPSRIDVVGSGRKRAWRVAITEDMRAEAEEELQRERETSGEDDG